MNQRTNEIAEIKAYLLGALDESETERIDELTVIDADFAEKVSSVENDLIDGYIAGELKGDELGRFESHFLATPRRREKVSFARAFQGFAEREMVPAEAAPAVFHRPLVAEKRSWFSDLSSPGGFFGGFRPAFQWGFAAAAAVVVLLGGWFIVGNLLRNSGPVDKASIGSGDDPLNREVVIDQPSQTPPVAANIELDDREANGPDETPAPTPSGDVDQAPGGQSVPRRPQVVDPPQRPQRALVAAFVLTPMTRGGRGPAEVSIPAGTERADFRLELESDDSPAYRATLRDLPGGKVVWTGQNLRASGNPGRRSLTARIPSRVLKPSAYSLSVSGAGPGDGGEIVGDYNFRVVR